MALEDFNAIDQRALLAARVAYGGVLFRSILEARWAIMFSMLGIKWKYEPKSFAIGRYRYTPDFHLDNVAVRSSESNGVFVEIKPNYREIEKREDFYMVFPGTLIAFAGDPPGRGTDYHYGYTDDVGGTEWGCGRFDNHMVFVRCVRCHHIKIEYLLGDYLLCPRCGGKVTSCNRWFRDYLESPFDEAVRAATRARIVQTGSDPKMIVDDLDGFACAMALM